MQRSARFLPGIMRGALAAYAVAVLLGLAMVLWAFPLFRLLGMDADRGLISGDSAQHIVGQIAFLADRWRWPLLNTQLLMPPAGVNVGLTDSIPLAAITAKILRHVLPAHVETILPWLALCWFVQPIAAVFALRGTGERRLLPAIAIAVIALSMPTLFWRSGHAGLSSHFLLLLGLGLYFRIVKHQRGACWAGAVLLPVSLLIHPYLMPMCAALLAAACLTLFLRRDRFWITASLGLGVGLALVAGLVMLLGYGGAKVSQGFGFYSMNLVSPFYPQQSWLLPGRYPTIDATGGQYEGYQYLGLGLLVLLAALLLCGRRGLRIACRAHAGLVLACCGLTLFAASNRIYLGHMHVLLTKAPDVLAQLRATGRFFWPVAYVIAVGGVALAMRFLPQRLASALVALVALLQMGDTYAQRQGFRALMHDNGHWAIDPVALRPIIATHRLVSLWPGASCWMRPETPALMQTLLLAVETHVAADTMYVSRSSSSSSATVDADCPPVAQLREDPAQDVLRVFLPGSPQGAIMEMPNADRLCKHVGGEVACSRQFADRRDLPAFSPVSVPRNTALPTAQDGAGVALLGGGWWRPDQDGVRPQADQADLLIDCKQGTLPRAVVLTLRNMPPRGDNAEAIRASIGRQPPIDWRVPPQPTNYTMPVPADSCVNAVLRIALAFPKPDRRNDTPHPIFHVHLLQVLLLP